MSIQFYPNGAGGAVGDQIDTCKPLQTTGSIWYVSSLIGTDAAAPAGQNREKPLATIAQAITNAASGDMIVFLSGHTQVIPAGQTIAKSLILVGEGTNGVKPAVTFSTSFTSLPMFSLTANNIELRNLYFPASPSTVSSPRIAVSQPRCRIAGCYSEHNGNDTSWGVQLNAGADSFRVTNSTFISTATSTALQPLGALQSTTTVADLEFDNVVISAGTVGFSNYAAVDLSAAAATRIRMTNVSLLLGADMKLGSASTGLVNVQLATAGSRVDWG